MYYRRKILLSILERWGGRLSNTSLQKLLFLYCQNLENKPYHFVPYLYGCFSFQSYADKRALTFYNILAKEGFWSKLDQTNYMNQLLETDKEKLEILNNSFHNYSQDDLIRYVYENFPYYAKRSLIREKYLLNTEDGTTKTDEIPILYTIGYEGTSIDEYLNKLIDQSITLVCDVRKNPISMKYGFSKNQLKNLLRRLKIKYLHIPELGIESIKRKNLNSKLDYKNLFNEYEQTLPEKKVELNLIVDLLIQNKRIALTCFESAHVSCHRGRIIEYMQKSPSFNYRVLHI